MNIIVAVDANIILSALLGGKPSSILFDPRFKFITTEFTIQEVEKYLPRLGKKLEIPAKNFKALLSKIPLKIYPRKFYQDYLTGANEVMRDIDLKDAEILALALKCNNYLWSQDKDFEKSEYQKLLKTYDFIN